MRGREEEASGTIGRQSARLIGNVGPGCTGAPCHPSLGGPKTSSLQPRDSKLLRCIATVSLQNHRVLRLCKFGDSIRFDARVHPGTVAGREL